MLKRIALAIVILVAALLIFAATKPDTFLIERAATIKAPAAKVFAFIDDFHRWNAWSPWDKLDSNMKRSFSGSAAGKGAVYEWEGNDKVGKGRMEIVDISPASHIVVKLDFFKPFEAHNMAEFTLVAQGDSTDIVWAMHGPNPYPAKLMQVFFSMDCMVGKDFEDGLAKLKTAAEK